MKSGSFRFRPWNPNCTTDCGLGIVTMRCFDVFCHEKSCDRLQVRLGRKIAENSIEQVAKLRRIDVTDRGDFEIIACKDAL